MSEAWGQDAATVLGHLSAVTERVALGSGLLQIPGRSPAMTAMTAATLDVMSGGRFRLGLGVSGPQVSEGWHGVDFSRPVARTREYVEIVRAALAREGPLSYDGREFQLPIEGGTGLGKPLKLLAKPVQQPIPIYLGAVGPKAVAQTAEIADGWLPFGFDPARADELLAPIRSSGRDVDVAPVVMICVDDDPARARDMARPWLTIYMGGMGAKGKNFYVDAAERAGFGESAREVQRLFIDGDRAAAGRRPQRRADRVERDLHRHGRTTGAYRRVRGGRCGHPARDAVRGPAGDRPGDRRRRRIESPPWRLARSSKPSARRICTTRLSPGRTSTSTSGFYWRLLKAIPAAEAAIGEEDEAEQDVMTLRGRLNDLTHSGEGELADALRPIYIDYLAARTRPAGSGSRSRGRRRSTSSRSRPPCRSARARAAAS